MDHRIFIGSAIGLVLLAFAGFYFAFGSRSPSVIPPARMTATPSQPTRGGAQSPAAKAPSSQSPTSQVPASQPPAKATAASVESEIAGTDNAPLQALLKKYFPDEYNSLIATAVERKNEGVSDEVFGQELFAQFQDLMRAKLKYAVGASTAMIDQLAANEVNLFHALGTDGAPFCLKILGKDTTPSETPPPANIRKMMQLGTLYRYQAIAEGGPNSKPMEPLTADEMGTFQAALTSDGMRFEDVRSGAFLNGGGDGPGQPCLMVEKLYRAIGRLPEGTRRKIYSGMFFLGRDK